MIQQPVSASSCLVHLEAVLVERDRFGDAVVAADDRGVAAGVARTDEAGIQHAHVGDAVAGGQVVGGRQAVAAGADDHDVVRRLGVTGLPWQVQQGLDELVHARRSSSS